MNRAFPESAWSGVISEYFDLVAHTTEAPDPFIWSAFVGAFSALIAPGVGLAWGGQKMRPILYLGLLGETGRSRKTTSIDDVRQLVLEPFVQGRTAEADALQIVNGSGSGEGFVEHLADRESAAGADGSPRGRQTGRRAIFLLDEMGALLRKAGRDQAGDLVGFMLRAFDMPSVLNHSLKAKQLVCTNATPTILAASTSSYLGKTLSEDLVHAGLLNRFLFVHGDRAELLPIRPPVDADAHQRLLQRIVAVRNGVWNRQMEFSNAAIVENDRRYRQDASREDTPLVAAASNRVHVHAIRLSMVFAAADGTNLISDRHMSAAWDVAEYGRSVVADLVSQIQDRTWREAESRVVERARRVAAEMGGSFSKTEVRQGVKGERGLESTVFNRLWDALVRAGDFIRVGDTSRYAFASSESPRVLGP